MPSGFTHFVINDMVSVFCVAEYKWMVAERVGQKLGNMGERSQEVQTSGYVSSEDVTDTGDYS